MLLRTYGTMTSFIASSITLIGLLRAVFYGPKPQYSRTTKPKNKTEKRYDGRKISLSSPKTVK